MAKQFREVHGRQRSYARSWIEPSVWTDRMLDALLKGVKGGKWYSLIDKVYSIKNLEASFKKVKANKGSAGIDHVSISMFQKRLDLELGRLSDDLKTGKYRPQSIKRVYIPKPGSKDKRPLGIPTVRDRVVQTALRNVLEPIFERDFADNSFGFRPRRSTKQALRLMDDYMMLKLRNVVDVDIKNYFDTIPHDRLIERIREKVSDERIIALIKMFLDQKIMHYEESWIPEAGSPQGGVISPATQQFFCKL